jgi:hypothetical protein
MRFEVSWRWWFMLHSSKLRFRIVWQMRSNTTWNPLTLNWVVLIDGRKQTLDYIVTSRQRPKYSHATIEKGLKDVFSMWSAPCTLLGNGSLNKFPQKQTRQTIRHLLLRNGAVNRLFQQYRMFSMSPPRDYITTRSPVLNQKWVVEGEREWSESSAVKEEGFGWRSIVSYCNRLWLREIVTESVNKSNHPIKNPLLLITEP